ncbi:uncharacterized protein CCR75_009655 [Bremia lactucae]|uniref:Uncharacterized protein n=1 Tax=Bremia lactucae TaxID=4779 RepID=A0A976ILA7_BRELC|nr:hypothetical protein CCR75_009655 [Bremia lactucae]
MAKKKVGLKSNARSNARKKIKKKGMFKALKKQDKRAVITQTNMTDPHTSKRKYKVAKRPATISDEFRNYDERVAASKVRRSGVIPKLSAVAPPAFVMAAPIFQFNATSMLKPMPREIEGFSGFLSALEAPKDATIANSNQHMRHSKNVEYSGNNVFSVLDNGDEEQIKARELSQSLSAFMQPATFKFPPAKSNFTMQPSLQSSFQQSTNLVLANAADIDPDL